MNKSRPKRPSANATRRKILKAATQLFMAHGFAGTSMGKLAAKAEINQTLIFHHFGNKQQLWQQVKISLLAEISVKPINETPKNLTQFLTEAFDQRISVYAQSPNLSRLVGWQKLESTHNKKDLWTGGDSAITPKQWIVAIEYLQKTQCLNPVLQADLVMMWLTSSIDGMLNDYYGLFENNPENKQHYIKMLINSLTIGLT